MLSLLNNNAKHTIGTPYTKIFCIYLGFNNHQACLHFSPKLSQIKTELPLPLLQTLPLLPLRPFTPLPSGLSLAQTAFMQKTMQLRRGAFSWVLIKPFYLIKHTKRKRSFVETGEWKREGVEGGTIWGGSEEWWGNIQGVLDVGDEHPNLDHIL